MAHTVANEYVINDFLYRNTNAHTRKEWLTLSVLHMSYKMVTRRGTDEHTDALMVMVIVTVIMLHTLECTYPPFPDTHMQ